jgi:hypothetical protein
MITQERLFEVVVYDSESGKFKWADHEKNKYGRKKKSGNIGYISPIG